MNENIPTAPNPLFERWLAEREKYGCFLVESAKLRAKDIAAIKADPALHKEVVAQMRRWYDLSELLAGYGVDDLLRGRQRERELFAHEFTSLRSTWGMIEYDVHGGITRWRDDDHVCGDDCRARAELYVEAFSGGVATAPMSGAVSK